MSNKFVIYWAFIVAQIVSLLFAYQQGLFQVIIASDVTMLSFVIMTIHTFTMFIIGYLTYKNITNIGPLWYVSEAQLGIGMIGTLIGFILMFSTVFISVTTPDEIATALSNIASGVGTALWTTLTGLVSSLIIKALLVNLEKQS